MLGAYMAEMRKLKMPNAEDIENLNELNDFYNKLRNEPDPVTVGIVNRSGSVQTYGESTINPGASLTVTVSSRKLGETEIQEGAFNFQNTAFVYNPSLEKEASWDASRYAWKVTGPFSYQLTILN